MKQLILVLVLSASFNLAYGQTVVVGSNGENVVGIRGLKVGNDVYDIEFWGGDFSDLYAPHRERFPFIGDAAGAAAADLAIRQILNATEYERVGWGPFDIFYAVVSNPFKQTHGNVEGSGSYFEQGSAEWLANPSNPIVSVQNTNYVVLMAAPAGDVNRDGDVDVSDLLELEQVLTEP